LLLSFFTPVRPNCRSISLHEFFNLRKRLTMQPHKLAYHNRPHQHGGGQGILHLPKPQSQVIEVQMSSQAEGSGLPVGLVGKTYYVSRMPRPIGATVRRRRDTPAGQHSCTSLISRAFPFLWPSRPEISFCHTINHYRTVVVGPIGRLALCGRRSCLLSIC
jgi:hypothetical protein